MNNSFPHLVPADERSLTSVEEKLTRLSLFNILNSDFSRNDELSWNFTQKVSYCKEVLVSLNVIDVNCQLFTFDFNVCEVLWNSFGSESETNAIWGSWFNLYRSLCPLLQTLNEIHNLENLLFLLHRNPKWRLGK